MTQRRFNWELFLSVVYGVILGIAGNIFAEFWIQLNYLKEISKADAIWGMIMMIIVMMIGAVIIYWLSSIFTE